MQGLITKLYQSLISKDQLVKAFLASNSLIYKVNPAVAGYENLDNHLSSLGESRTYRKIANKAEIMYSRGLKLQEQFWFSNYATRDLVQFSSVSTFVQLLKPILNRLLVTHKVLVHELTKQAFDQPPPVKSTLIQDINLSPRLLLTPTAASASWKLLFKPC